MFFQHIEHFRIEMIFMCMTAENYYRFIDVELWNLSFEIIKQKITFVDFNEKAAVIDKVYFQAFVSFLSNNSQNAIEPRISTAPMIP